VSYRNLFSLSDKIALVVGAAGGLAEETCLALADFGARLFLADLDLEGLTRICNRLAENADRIASQSVDITDTLSIQNLMNAVGDRFGRLDILINFAGVGWRTPIESIDSAEFQKIIQINLTGSFELVKHGLPLMIAHGSGKIVLVGSGIRSNRKTLCSALYGQQRWYSGHGQINGHRVGTTKYPGHPPPAHRD
jgi:3-oxoacyl-[acyl-carrier protein] reductase